MGKCCGCWSPYTLYVIDGDEYCPRCAAKEANDIYGMMDEPTKRKVFDDAFGAYKDLEVFETFWDDLSDDDHLELMGFKRLEDDGSE